MPPPPIIVLATPLSLVHKFCGMLEGYQFNQIIHKRMYASISGIINDNMVGICNVGFIIKMPTKFYS